MALLSVLEMHRLIEQDVQKMGFFAYDSLETEEIDLKINEQIYAFIEAVLDVTQGRVPKIGVEEGFQKNQVSLDSLRTLHLKDQTTTLSTFTDGKKFDVDTNIYLHHIKTKLTVTYSCSENGSLVTKTLSPSPVLRVGESQHIDNMRRSSFHKTKKESPLGEIAGNTVYIYTDSSFNVTEAFIDFIKKPAKVTYAKSGGNYDSNNSVHCDLPDSVHYMIVKMTVAKILKVIETTQQKIVNLETQ